MSVNTLAVSSRFIGVSLPRSFYRCLKRQGALGFSVRRHAARAGRGVLARSPEPISPGRRPVFHRLAGRREMVAEFLGLEADLKVGESLVGRPRQVPIAR